MAVRLSVLVLRPFGAGSSWHEQCDDLLGHLLGRPGLDVTLLERLPIPGDGSTETLALESIGGHAACLAWQDPNDVVADLARAGKPTGRRAHAGDPGGDETGPEKLQASKSDAGRMYFFDMRRRRDVFGALGELQSLLKTLQLPTFQIMGTTPSRTVTLNARKPDGKRSEAGSRDAVSSLEAMTKPIAVNDRSSDALDRLVDELEELDI